MLNGGRTGWGPDVYFSVKELSSYTKTTVESSTVVLSRLTKMNSRYFDGGMLD